MPRLSVRADADIIRTALEALRGTKSRCADVRWNMVSMQTTWRWAMALIVLGGSLIGSGQEAPSGPDKALSRKSAYRLFHPTPTADQREMSTDRPDQTESAYTVDAGHFQLEMDLVTATFDRSYGCR